MGFPQYGFKLRRLLDQLYPARSRPEVKHQVCIPPYLQRFDRAFVVIYPPSCPSAGIINQPASGQSDDHLSPRVLGSRRVLLSLPLSLLRPDPPVSTTPTDFPGALVIPQVCARRPGLGYRRDLPCFGSTLLPDVPAPLRREEERRYPRHFTAPKGFPQQNSASAPLFHPTPASVGDLLTTLQCSLYATARKVACPPGLVRPRVKRRPPRTYTPELARGWSPTPRAGYDYTALLGKDDDRTYTGWSAAVTGCAFCRKVAFSRVRESGSH